MTYWINNDNECRGTFRCSKCNAVVPPKVVTRDRETGELLPVNLWRYCPNCGAKMKGGTENE